MIPKTKEEFITRIRSIAWHKKELAWIKSGKKKIVTLEKIEEEVNFKILNKAK